MERVAMQYTRCCTLLFMSDTAIQSQSDVLKKHIIIEQGNKSFNIDLSERISYVRLVNGVPTSTIFSPKLLEVFVDGLTKNPTHIGYFKSSEKDKS